MTTFLQLGVYIIIIINFPGGWASSHTPHTTRPVHTGLPVNWERSSDKKKTLVTQLLFVLLWTNIRKQEKVLCYLTGISFNISVQWNTNNELWRKNAGLMNYRHQQISSSTPNTIPLTFWYYNSSCFMLSRLEWNRLVETSVNCVK